MKKEFFEADTNLKEQILDQIPTPVFSVDLEMNITYMNQAGLSLLDKSKNEVVGQTCFSVWNSKHCKTEDCCMGKSIVTGKAFSARTKAEIKGKVVTAEY